MRRPALLFAAVPFALMAALPPPAAAETVADPAACAALTDRNPAAAVEAAQAWGRAGGGAEAALCEALALAAGGAPGAAAVRLEALAAAAGAGLGPAARARVLEVAAGFWLGSGRPESAGAAARAGLALSSPASVAGPLHRRAAEAAAELGDPAAALAEANLAIAATPEDAEALLLRARLHRLGGRPAVAEADAAAAVALIPQDARGWLEQGLARVDLRRRSEARDSLLAAVERDRGGPVGDAAQGALQRLDVR